MAKRFPVRLLRLFRTLEGPLLEVCVFAGSLLSSVDVKLSIPGSAKVSRLVFDPPMGSNMRDLVWPQVFQFQSKNGHVESLVWRRFAPEDGCVHAIGLIMEAKIKESGRSKDYVGNISALVDEILSYRNQHGHGFSVVHDPKEGLHHVHIGYSQGPQPMTKQDKADLKVKLELIFSEQSGYQRPSLN